MANRESTVYKAASDGLPLYIQRRVKSRRYMYYTEASKIKYCPLYYQMESHKFPLYHTAVIHDFALYYINGKKKNRTAV